jgi:hypothetical protein
VCRSSRRPTASASTCCCPTKPSTCEPRRCERSVRPAPLPGLAAPLLRRRQHALAPAALLAFSGAPLAHVGRLLPSLRSPPCLPLSRRPHPNSPFLPLPPPPQVQSGAGDVRGREHGPLPGGTHLLHVRLQCAAGGRGRRQRARGAPRAGRPGRRLHGHQRLHRGAGGPGWALLHALCLVVDGLGGLCCTHLFGGGRQRWFHRCQRCLHLEVQSDKGVERRVAGGCGGGCPLLHAAAGFVTARRHGKQVAPPLTNPSPHGCVHAAHVLCAHQNRTAETYCQETAKERAVVAWNMELDTLRSDLGEGLPALLPAAAAAAACSVICAAAAAAAAHEQHLHLHCTTPCASCGVETCHLPPACLAAALCRHSLLLLH